MIIQKSEHNPAPALILNDTDVPLSFCGWNSAWIQGRNIIFEDNLFQIHEYTRKELNI